MVENIPNGEDEGQVPLSPYHDDLWLQNEATGSVLVEPDPELMGLLVRREELHDRFIAKGGAAQIDEKDKEDATEVAKQIKDKKVELGFDPFAP